VLNLGKSEVKAYWDKVPCGTRNIKYLEGTFEYFNAVSRNRYKVEPFIEGFAEFDKWDGKKILEVGCGAGSDLIRFAQCDAIVTGIDLSTKSVSLAKQRFSLYHLAGNIKEADAEQMPFEDNKFDMVYSNGVLHHTPDTNKAISEIYRVLKPNGEIRVMVYHKYSIVALQMYILFGILRLQLFQSIDSILYNHHESLGTKAYTVEQVRSMFSMFKNLEVKTVVSNHDIRYARNKYFPDYFKRLVPDRFGWYILVKGVK
jgi:ubiquinone/menaquinone biosynthesis C-methylase UbiE